VKVVSDFTEVCEVERGVESGVGLVFGNVCIGVAGKWKSIFLINTCSLKGLKVSLNSKILI